MEDLENKNATNEKLSPELFEFVNQDNKQIHDEKFKTKPTTFAKDALKRFAKNKSSVVGAVIIGVLLLGSFLSVFSPHDIKKSHTDQALLMPKLFEAGTGFWDGTQHFSGIPYDDEIGGPSEFVKEHCYHLSFDSDNVQYIDKYYRKAKGGILMPYATRALKKSSKPENYPIKIYNYFDFAINKDDNLEVAIDFVNIDNIVRVTKIDSNETSEIEAAKRICPTFAVYIVDTKGTYSRIDEITEDDDVYEIFSGTQEDYKMQKFNLSKAVTDLGLESIEHARLMIHGYPVNDTEEMYYYLIRSITFTTTSTNADLLKRLDEVSITDPNHTSGLQVSDDGYVPAGKWNCTLGERTYADLAPYHAEVRTVSFDYDWYGDKLGLKHDFVVGGSDFRKYIEKGWCEFTDFNDITTFKILDADRCPVISVKDSSYDTAYDVYQFTCDIYYYKYSGYTKMPKYLFGTDGAGHDLITVALSSLKTSLLVAIISSAVCLVIGLIWGSISGYFGGTVDLLMERFTDILGGIPWIVMMTLIILHLGNNIVTFAFALIMTGWIGTASRTRTQFYRFRGREYVLASRTLGANDARLIFRHILPNGLGTIVTGSVLMIPGCIFSEASISYLGLGLKGVDSFGVLLSTNQKYIGSYPVLIIVPAIIISLLMISFNLFGNGLRDALNPTLKGGEQ